MRTNIVLNEDLLREAGKYSSAKTKRSLVEESLKVFIQTKASERKVTTYQERLRRLDKELTGLRLRESPHKVLREARERS